MHVRWQKRRWPKYVCMWLLTWVCLSVSFWLLQGVDNIYHWVYAVGPPATNIWSSFGFSWSSSTRRCARWSIGRREIWDLDLYRRKRERERESHHSKTGSPSRLVFSTYMYIYIYIYIYIFFYIQLSIYLWYR